MPISALQFSMFISPRFPQADGWFPSSRVLFFNPPPAAAGPPPSHPTRPAAPCTHSPPTP